MSENIMGSMFSLPLFDEAASHIPRQKSILQALWTEPDPSEDLLPIEFYLQTSLNQQSQSSNISETIRGDFAELGDGKLITYYNCVKGQNYLMQGAQQEKPPIHNPICKETYNSLPKIYGSGKLRRPLYRFKLDNSHRSIKHNCFSTVDVEPTVRKSPTTRKRQAGRFLSMSLPKAERCTKKHCSCFAHYEDEESHRNKQPTVTKKKVLLKPIKVDKPDDLESHHKILRRSEPIGFLPMGIYDGSKRSERQVNPEYEIRYTQEDINEEEESEASYLRSKTEQVSVINQLTQLVQGDLKEEMNADNAGPAAGQADGNSNKNQEKKKISSSVEIQVNLSSDEIQQKTEHLEEDQPEPPFKQYGANTDPKDDIYGEGQLRNKVKQKKYKYKSRIRRARYEETDSEESQQSKKQQENVRPASSCSSVCVSSRVLKGVKTNNTQFHILNQKESGQDLRSSRANSVRSNGRFRVPDRSSYKKYLKGYKVMDQKSFNMKDLVKKPLFTIVEEEDGVYFGEYENNLKNGTGLCVSQQQIFEGTYENDVKVKGSERNIDGIYRGYFLNGKREGYGTFEWNNGETFEGNWHQGMKTGFGVWRSPKGDSYEGEWLNNRQHGSGRYKHKNSHYQGEFQNFLKHGHGEQKFANGDSYVGQYFEGKPHGQGFYAWHDGSNYEGQFKNGVRWGFGRLVQHSGNVYEGHFQNDFKHGEGKLTSKSGVEFEGIFEEGEKLSGTIFYPDGRVEKFKSNE